MRQAVRKQKRGDQAGLLVVEEHLSELEVAVQKWEYLQIVCEEGRPRYVNGKEIPNWQQGPIFWEAMRHLFRKGWELVDHPLAPTSDLWIAHKQWLDNHWEETPHHFRRSKN